MKKFNVDGIGERRGKGAKERRYTQLNFRIDRPGIILLSSTEFMDAVASRFASSFFIVSPRLRSNAANDSFQNIRENKAFCSHTSDSSVTNFCRQSPIFPENYVLRRYRLVTLKYTRLRKIISEFRTSIERLHDARELHELDSILIDKLKFVHRGVTLRLDFQMKINETRTRGHSLCPR